MGIMPAKEGGVHIPAREKTQVRHQCGPQQDGLTQGKQAMLARVQVWERVSDEGQRSKCGLRLAKCSTNDLGLQLERDRDLLRDDKKAIVRSRDLCWCAGPRRVG